MGWSENGYPQHLMVCHHVPHNVAILEIYHMFRQTQIIEKTNPFAGTALPETSHTTPNQYNWGKPTNLVRNGRTLRIGVSLKIGLKLGCYKVANPKS